MRFTVILGQPYLVAHGVAYPVDIEGTEVSYFEEGSVSFKGEGEYCLDEIRAKYGSHVKHRTEKRRKRKEE